MSKEERIKACLEDMSDTDLIGIYNEYCQENCYSEEEFFSMDMFDELNYGRKPLEIAEYVRDCDFNPNDDYFRDGIFGPTSYSTYECADEIRTNELKELAEYIIDNDESFYNSDIRDALYEDDDEEEDEAED